MKLDSLQIVSQDIENHDASKNNVDTNLSLIVLLIIPKEDVPNTELSIRLHSKLLV